MYISGGVRLLILKRKSRGTIIPGVMFIRESRVGAATIQEVPLFARVRYAR